MGKRIDISGKRFGRLLAVKELSQKHRKVFLWLCKCDCGKDHITARYNLIRGDSRSCGCYRSDITKIRERMQPYQALYNIVVKRAEKRKISFELSYEEFVDFTNTCACYYCGDEVKWTKFNTGKNPKAYNLDRINSSKGYSKDNCHVCCFACNMFKGSWSETSFLNHINKIHDNFRSHRPIE